MNLIIFFIFAILGPPLGVIVMFMPGFIWSLVTFTLKAKILNVSIESLATIMKLSYLFGGVQAALAGLLAVSSHESNERKKINPFFALPLGLGFAFLATLSMTVRSQKGIEVAPMIISFLGIAYMHIVPALICWAIAQALMRLGSRRIKNDSLVEAQPFAPRSIDDGPNRP